MISLKSHSVMALELPARGRGINRQGGELFIGQAAVGRALDLCAQAFDQFRRGFVCIHWIATKTGAITAMQRLVGRREKIDILAGRLFGRASGATEDSGSAHADKENSLET